MPRPKHPEKSDEVWHGVAREGRVAELTLAREHVRKGQMRRAAGAPRQAKSSRLILQISATRLRRSRMGEVGN